MKYFLSSLFMITAFIALSGGANAYSNNRLMDNAIFDNVATMSEQQIRGFINSRPDSCLAKSGAIFPEPITYFQYGGNVDAARVIYNSARYSDVNPQVILTTLQKEQSLISRTNCFEQSGIDSRNKAMGMGCPDGGECPAPAYAGFHQQVMKGTWQLGFNRQRAVGNVGWGGNDNITYYGYMTRGNYKRCASCETIFYDGFGIVDGQNIYIETGATASLYTYTPHLGQAFPGIFEGWFGPVLTSYCLSGTPGPVVTDVKFRKLNPNIDSGNLTIYSGSSTKCIESHTWNRGYGSWQQNISSNYRELIPGDEVLEYADLNGDGRDEPMIISLNNTGSGMVEFHIWDYSMKNWIVHAISNLPTTTSSMAVLFTDINGDGGDEAMAMVYNGTSTGMVEFHRWGPGAKTWAEHTVSNLPVINPSNMNIFSADLNGDRRDELIAAGIGGTGTGMVEFHVWNSGMASWKSHHVSNLPTTGINGDSGIYFADTNGDKIDEGILVGRRNTGSGRIEFHTWNHGFGTWQSHIPSNQPTF